MGDQLKGVYRFLAEHRGRVFPVDHFADCSKDSHRGRPRCCRRMRACRIRRRSTGSSAICDGKAAAGVDAGAKSFHPTTLVGRRNRLRASERPKRFLEDTKVAAREAGVMGSRGAGVGLHGGL